MGAALGVFAKPAGPRVGAEVTGVELFPGTEPANTPQPVPIATSKPKLRVVHHPELCRSAIANYGWYMENNWYRLFQPTAYGAVATSSVEMLWSQL
jgi:hypothetical protein